MTEQPQRDVAILHSIDYVRLCAKAPFHSGREELIAALLDAYGLLDELLVVAPPPRVSDYELEHFHSTAYLNALNRLSRVSDPSPSDLEEMERFGLMTDCPVFPELPAYARTLCGATLEACRLLRERTVSVAINWAGGRHHAHASHGSGFCYLSLLNLLSHEFMHPYDPRILNNIIACQRFVFRCFCPDDAVLAVLSLTAAPPPANPAVATNAVPALPRRSKSRVLYLDTDVHHGDGVEEAFLSSTSVMTLSIHRHDRGFFPGSGSLQTRGAGCVFNVPLKASLREPTFLRVFETLFEKAATHFQPDWIVWTCGADTIPGDPLLQGDGFNLATDTLAKCVRHVRRRLPDVPLLLLGGGGYHAANAARAFCQCTAAALGKQLDPEIPGECEEFEKFGPDYTLSAAAPSFREDQNNPADIDRVLAVLCSRMDALASTT